VARFVDRFAVKKALAPGNEATVAASEGRKRSNLLPVVTQANLDAGQPFDVAADGPRTGRRNLHLCQDAYASAINSRGSQLAYSSFEFNFALRSPMTYVTRSPWVCRKLAFLP
jgi:hypothetical protein